jgi:hypothetical protein
MPTPPAQVRYFQNAVDDVLTTQTPKTCTRNNTGVPNATVGIISKHHGKN